MDRMCLICKMELDPECSFNEHTICFVRYIQNSYSEDQVNAAVKLMRSKKNRKSSIPLLIYEKELATVEPRRRYLKRNKSVIIN